MLLRSCAVTSTIIGSGHRCTGAHATREHEYRAVGYLYVREVNVENVLSSQIHELQNYGEPSTLPKPIYMYIVACSGMIIARFTVLIMVHKTLTLFQSHISQKGGNVFKF